MFRSKFRIALLAVSIALVGCDSPDQKAQAYVDKAKVFLAEDNYEAAHIEFSNAMQINPNHIEGLYLLTKVFEQNKEWPKVYRYLEKVLELDPNHVEAILAIGNLELAAQQLDGAIKRSEKAIELAPESVDVRAFRSLLLYKLGDLEGAVTEAEFVLAKEPENIEAIMVLASERLEADDPAKAIAYLDNVSINDNLLLHVMKIKAFNIMKDLDGAVAVFNKLIELEPEKDEYYFALAKQYISFKDLENAEVVLRNLIQQEPDNNQAKLALLEFISTFQGEEYATVALQEYLQAQPDNYDLSFNLVRRLLQSDNTTEAQTLLEDIAAKDGNSDVGLKAKNMLANMAFAAGDLEQGDSYLRQVLSVEPDNAEAVVTESKRLLQDNKSEQAISKLRAVLKSNTNSPTVLGLLGAAHEQQGRTELAVDLYAKAFRADATNRSVILSYSRLLIKLTRYTQAQEILNSLLLSAPSDIEALKLMAQVKLTLQDWEGAQNIARSLDSVEKDSAEQIRGAAYQGNKQFKQSVASFEKAYDVAEDKVRPMAALVRSYIVTGNTDAAVSFLQSILNLDADNYPAQLLLGQLYSFMQKTDQAEAAFQSAIALHPGKVDAYRALSRALVRDKRNDEAVAVLKAGLENISNDLNLTMTLASVYERSGKYGKAIDLYTSVLEHNPDADIAANNLAVILSESEQYRDLERAKKLASRFRDSEVPHFQDTLGWINYKQGELNNALYFHENAVESLPEFAEFRYHLGMSYKAAGDLTKARTELEKALSLAEDSNALWIASAREALKGL
ncbi:tetratricopeptide repeat protein [Amphritea sp. HPY]|uniref:tetratricopeptide repeat protein n=1 Tax=Amphritea sp. HPY TaxID=3421652 RepID=UPI003D7C3CD3